MGTYNRTHPAIRAHFDWTGSEEALKKFDESAKIARIIDGAEFIERLSPQSMKCNWIHFFKFKDYSTYQKYGDAWYFEYKRPAELTNGEYAFFV
jgi:hypothetical protein